MQTKNEPVTRIKNLKENEKVENSNFNKNTNKANKPYFKDEAGDSNKNQVGNKNFIETIYKKTLPNSNLIDKENLKIAIEKNKLLGYQKEEESSNQNNHNFPQEIQSHRQSNNNINIGSVSNKEMVLAKKDINKRKISNSFILEKSDSPVRSKEKTNLNNNIRNSVIKWEPSNQSNINNNFLNVNNTKIIKNENSNSNNNNEIKNIQINFSKTTNNFNTKNSEKNTIKGNQVIDNSKPSSCFNNKYNNISSNNNNYMEIIEQKLHFKKAGNKTKNINKSNLTSKDENLLEKTDQKSSDKDKASRSNSKNNNKSKSKFKSNQKLENHLGYATKTFYNNKNLNQKIELASTSSGFSNFFAKNRGHINTKSEFDIAKNSNNNNNNFNLILKNNEQIGKTIRIINDSDLNKNSKNKLDSQLLEKIAKNDIDDYYKIISNGNKENNECNLIKNSSLLANAKNKTSVNICLITDKTDKPGNVYLGNSNLKIKNFDMQKLLSNEEIMKTNNILTKSPTNNLIQSTRKNKKLQRISIDSNRTSLNNSFDHIAGVAKIQEKIINSNRIFSANTRLEKNSNIDNFHNLFNNAKEIADSKENLIFNNYNRNSSKFISNQGGVLKNKMSASDKSIKNLISNDSNTNDCYFNKNNFEVKNKCSNANENIFLDKIKQKKESNEGYEDLRISFDRKNKKNLLSSTGYSNNSHSNIKFLLNTQDSGLKLDKRIASPLNKIDTKKLKIMIINKETSTKSDGKSAKKDFSKLNILGTNSNCNEALEEEKADKASDSKVKARNSNLSEIKNIRIESTSKNIEIDNSNINQKHNNTNKSKNSNNPNNSNINKTYSTLAKKLKKNKESKLVLECSNNSNFEIISCKPDKKTDEEIAINRNKSYDISKNYSNKSKENQSNSKNLDFEIINHNFDLIKTNLNPKSNANSNSNNDENNNNFHKKDVFINNFNLDNELYKEYSNFSSDKKNRENLIRKNNNLFNSVNDLNFNTKTTKDTLKLSYYQNKNFSNIEIEGPEELHMLYINLNQQNKKLIYKFEKIDETIKADKDFTSTVFNYDNEVEI